MHAAQQALARKGVVSKHRTSAKGRVHGGLPLSRGALFHLLRNRLYLGEIPHHDTTYPGQHAAIIPRALFDAVQAGLDGNARQRRSTREGVARSALAGRIFDATGQPMSPTFAYGRKRRLYRYYVSASLQQGARSTGDDPAPRRISAEVIEALLSDTLSRLLPDQADKPLDPIDRIEVHRHHIDLMLPIRLLRPIQPGLGPGEAATRDPAAPGRFRLVLATGVHRRGGKTRITAGAPDAPRPDPVLIRAMRAAHAMLAMSPSGAPTLAAAPASPYRRRLIRLAFLAPDLQRAIIEGRQPPGLTLASLMTAEMPLTWSGQREMFGATTPT